MDEPKARAPQELQFRLRVDEAHCDRAAQGLRRMAEYQYRGLAQRYADNRWLGRFQLGARKFAPALAPVVFMAAGVAVWVACVDEPARRRFFWLAAILFVEALALWLLPRRANRIGAGLRNWFARRFGNRAAAMMRKTRRAAPFEAVYDLRGDLLTYARIQEGRWTQRWHRHLGRFQSRGVALRTPGLLAIFRKPGTVVPAIVVLTAEDSGLPDALRALGWTILDIDPETGARDNQ